MRRRTRRIFLKPPRIDVTGQAVASPTPYEDTKLKLDHIMKELAGTEITVTKKTSV